MTRPQELDDLDRVNDAVMDLDVYCEARTRLYRLSQERMEANHRANELLRLDADERRERKAIVVWCVKCALIFLCGVAIALYLQSIGY